MDTIALCIPAFNAAKYLPRLLESAKIQLFPFKDILVYDDASTDNTSAIAEQYGAKVIYGEVNRAARLVRISWQRQLPAIGFIFMMQTMNCYQISHPLRMIGLTEKIGLMWFCLITNIGIMKLMSFWA